MFCYDYSSPFALRCQSILRCYQTIPSQIKVHPFFIHKIFNFLGVLEIDERSEIRGRYESQAGFSHIFSIKCNGKRKHSKFSAPTCKIKSKWISLLFYYSSYNDALVNIHFHITFSTLKSVLFLYGFASYPHLIITSPFLTLLKSWFIGSSLCILFASIHLFFASCQIKAVCIFSLSFFALMCIKLPKSTIIFTFPFLQSASKYEFHNHFPTII